VRSAGITATRGVDGWHHERVRAEFSSKPHANHRSAPAQLFELVAANE